MAEALLEELELLDELDVLELLDELDELELLEELAELTLLELPDPPPVPLPPELHPASTSTAASTPAAANFRGTVPAAAAMLAIEAPDATRLPLPFMAITFLIAGGGD